MGSTRIELAVDDMEPEGEEFESSCDDIRPAWLVQELNGSTGGNDFDSLWSDR